MPPRRLAPIIAVLATLLMGCGSGSNTAATDPGAPPSRSALTWVGCANEYSGCSFSGLRDVRYVLNGTATVATFYGGLDDCEPGRFGLSTGGSGAAKCEYASAYKTKVLANANPGMGGLGTSVVVPLGHPGYSDLRVQSTTDLGAASDIGAFRNPCSPTHFAFDDPIVSPGLPGTSHLHMFFGNTLTDAFSTAASLASTGSSSCAGGIANRTAYWVPAMLDASNNVVLPDGQLFYYKSGYLGVKPSDVKVMPPGLRIIAGDKTSTAYQPNANWGCVETYLGHFGTIQEVTTNPKCPAGNHVVMSVDFPQCWDGVNLDAPDHKSHMAYASNGCPPAFPVALPVITFNIDYVIPPGGAKGWHLSSDMYDYAKLGGGLSAHGDWFNAWDPAIKASWITNCVDASKDCHAFLLGDGRTLF